MAANYYPILRAVQSIVNGLTLVDWNNRAVPSTIRKLPKVDEAIDTLPLVCVVPTADPPQRKSISFGPYYKMTYPCEVVFIAAGNRDFTTNLSIYMGWQTAIAAAFNSPAALHALVPAVYDVDVRLGLVVDRGQINDNYDYGGLTIAAITSENN